ncbi:MAG: type II secretion system F family protein [Candidatus Micrarchaeota archaeon]|nr:type II secretion system F family protein [Candidatus Micrarchaeota archaeon]
MKIGRFLLHLFPGLPLDLKNADIDEDPEKYLSKAFYHSLMIFLLFGFLLYPVFGLASLPVSGFLAAFRFASILSKPRTIILRKTREIEKFLPFAIRHILIQLRSGVPLFNSLISVSKGPYGSISKEFSKVVKEVSGGVPLTSSLEKLGRRIPSKHFRRVVWQISNSLRSGTDVASVLSETLKMITEDQRLSVRRYGSQMNPFALVYMMFSIILPSLSISFLMVLSAFSRIPVSQEIFYMIISFMIVFQISFLGLIRTKRPSVWFE